MSHEYKTIYRGGSGEIVEKKSRFIATVRPVSTEEEALEFITEMKKKYYDARHNCSAYIIGRNSEIVRFSDDGEPSGTAGKPILEVLQKEELKDTAIVVTRYFGGTLLGTGGLVRAYTQAAKEGINDSSVITKKAGVTLGLLTDYNGIGKIQYLLAQSEIPILKSDYSDTVVIECMVPTEQLESIKKQITELTSGQCKIDVKNEVFYAVIEGEVLLFDS